MARRSFRAQLLALALLVSVAAPAAGAPPANVLSHPSVMPGTGTTATTFTFAVDYTGTAATVTASVANLTVPMNLVSGVETDGTYRGSARLPAGSWAVTFNANAAHGKDAAPLAGPRVTVAPVATPRPTAPPTPRPTSPPPTPIPTPAPPPLTATPLSPTVAGSATPGASEVGVPSASGFLGGFLVTPVPTATAAASPGGGLAPGDELWTLAMGGLIAISVLAFVAMVAILRDRSRASRMRDDWAVLFGDPEGTGPDADERHETVSFVPREPDE